MEIKVEKIDIKVEPSEDSWSEEQPCLGPEYLHPLDPEVKSEPLSEDEAANSTENNITDSKETQSLQIATNIICDGDTIQFKTEVNDPLGAEATSCSWSTVNIKDVHPSSTKDTVRACQEEQLTHNSIEEPIESKCPDKFQTQQKLCSYAGLHTDQRHFQCDICSKAHPLNSAIAHIINEPSSSIIAVKRRRGRPKKYNKYNTVEERTAARNTQKRLLRALLNQEDRAREAAYKRRRREEESSDARRRRLQREAELQRLRRSLEDDVARQARLERNKVLRKQKLSEETPEEREIRKNREAEWRRLHRRTR